MQAGTRSTLSGRRLGHRASQGQPQRQPGQVGQEKDAEGQSRGSPGYRVPTSKGVPPLSLYIFHIPDDIRAYLDGGAEY